MTNWSPDTCGCEIEISDDPKTLGETVRHVTRCAVHEALDHDHVAVLAENRLKNQVCNEVKAATGKMPKWSFDADRTVAITVDATATEQEKSDLVTDLATKFPDKVRVV